MSKSWFGGNIVCPMCGEATVPGQNGREHVSGQKDHEATIVNPGFPTIDQGGMKGGVSPYMTTRKKQDDDGE